MLMARLATAGVLLAACVSALFLLPNLWWTAVLLAALVVASREWAVLAGLQRAARSVFAAGVAASAVGVWLLVAATAPGTGRISVPEVLIYSASCIFWAFIAVPWLAWGWQARSKLAMAAAGWIVLVPAWLALARLQADPQRLLAVLAIVWLADTAAYLCGRAWGRHKLAPSISPAKTWEGVAGAVAAVAVYYVALSGAVPDWAWLQGGRGPALFAGVALMAVAGDLFESWMKRQAGVKDSGTLLPGHGGVLDRIDSMASSLPFAALLLSAPG
jgi:phosphatidate cytidylyltransferase